jgi:AraC-like DNA-binding protein
MIITIPPSTTMPGGPARGSPAGSYILHERAAEFRGAGTGYLSIKSFFGGQASYTVDRRRYLVSERAFLVLNEGQPYEIALAASAPIESFCVFFAPGLAETIQRSLTTPDDRLLLDPAPLKAAPLNFYEQTYPHDGLLSPALLSLRRALGSGRPADPLWLGERLHDLARRLLQLHGNVERAIERLPAARRATREELYRRLQLARELAEAAFDTPLTLDDMARAAGLSPNHLLRTFKQVFGQTPYQYLVATRLARARHLLEHTEQPVTEICLAVGFTSLGAFSWLFRQRVGVSPAEYRRQTR